MWRLAPLFFLTSIASAQTTWYVDAAATAPGTGTSGDPFHSLQFALDQVQVVDGDTILVADGVYAESVDFVGKGVRVAAGGAGRPRIVGAPGQDVSTVQFRSGEGSGAILEGIEVTGGIGTNVGGVRYGGGILIERSTPTLRDVVIRGSNAQRGAGLALLRGRVVLSHCLVDDNTARRMGAGVYAAGALVTMDNTTLSGNRTTFERGGGFFGGPHSVLNLDHCTVESNQSGSGAGVYSLGHATLNEVTFQGNTIIDGYSGRGGGAYLTEATATNCTLIQNGGPLCLEGAGARGGQWIDSEFRGNFGECFGAGLEGGETDNCLFEGNQSQAFQGDVPSPPGGGAAHSTLRHCRIIGNSADAQGGGAYECDLEDCIIQYNVSSWRDWAGGGGVFGGTAERCLIADNYASASVSLAAGGGGAAAADLKHCVVRGNFAHEYGAVAGGTLDHCTVVNNVSGDPASTAIGGAVIHNSIVWGNGGTAFDAQCTVTYSAIEGGAPGVGNLAVDPGLYGPGSDVRLTPTSPCIDTGDPASPLDADGTQADIGAFAFDPQWVTEGGSFCLAADPIELLAPASVSSPSGAVGGSSSVQLFLLSTTNTPSLTPFAGASILDVPSALCLTGRIVRVLPSPGGVLPLGAAELATYGLGAGDRLFVQGWSATAGFTAALDVVVQP